MSEVLVINTEDSLVKPKAIQPLPIFNEHFPLLMQEMPEYKEVLPNPGISHLAESLKHTLQKCGGLGLSANQCGIPVRMFIIGHEQFQLVCINPKVLAKSDEMVKDDEGCLSFPGLFCKIERPKWIEVEFTNEQGQVIQTKLEGLTARCYLHELDHMNGIKFTSYVGPVALRMAQTKQKKRIREAIKRKKNGLLF